MTRNDSFSLSLANMPERSCKPIHISTLNPVCLDTIFANFTLSELLTLRGVCRHWKQCIDTMFARTGVIELFGNKTELKRLQVAMAVRHFDLGQYYLVDSSLKGVFVIKEDTDHHMLADILIKCFPNIRRLLFQRYNDIYLDGITKLLKKCPFLLEVSFGYMPANRDIDPQFWDTLNSMPQLRSIMFHNLYKTVIPEELPILKHMHCFHIAHYRRSLVPILSQLGPNCWRIFLTWVYLTSEELECIINNNPMLTLSLTSLRLEYIASSENRASNYKRLIETLVTHFKSIAHLDICFGDHLDFAFLLPKLHCLPHLEVLYLYFDNNQIPRKEQLNKQIRPLLTLKTLVLESYKLSGEELLFWISFMFPNLEQLNIYSKPPDWRVDAAEMKERFFVSLSKLKRFNLKVG